MRNDLQDANRKDEAKSNLGSAGDLKFITDCAGKDDDHQVATDACESIGIPEYRQIDAGAMKGRLVPDEGDRRALSDRCRDTSNIVQQYVCSDAVVRDPKPGSSILREDIQVKRQERELGQADDSLVEDLCQPEHLATSERIVDI